MGNLTLVPQDKMIERLQTIYTVDESEVSNETYRQLILDALRMHGAANVLCDQRMTANVKHAARIARLTVKSNVEDFLMKKYFVDRYWAHHVMNTITHYNLRPVEPGNITEFKKEPFYLKYLEFSDLMHTQI